MPKNTNLELSSLKQKRIVWLLDSPLILVVEGQDLHWMLFLVSMHCKGKYVQSAFETLGVLKFSNYKEPKEKDCP